MNQYHIDMKKILLFAIGIVLAVSMSAQNSHLTFKGVPVDGHLNEFVNEMKAAGFMHTDTKDGVATLRGDFAGYKNCLIFVRTLRPNFLVYEIVVAFPYRSYWYEAESDYKNLKEMLTQKYGAPIKVKEEFDSYTSDGSKFFRLRDYEGFYYCIFEAENGRLALEIEGAGSRGRVNLWYTDKANAARIEANAMNDL